MITVWSDGSCFADGGGGYAALIIYEGGHSQTVSGGALETSNNRMELCAAIAGISSTPVGSTVKLMSDSQYVLCIPKSYKTWESNGWATSSGRDVANLDLVLELVKQIKLRNMSYEWVRGHSGVNENELVDKLSRKEACIVRGVEIMAELQFETVPELEGITSEVVLVQPPLYKYETDGSPRFWRVAVRVANGIGFVVSWFGRLDGAIQTTFKTVNEGKNIGKTSETTPIEQAVAEATAGWTKQKKKLYYESLEEAKTDSKETTEFQPMLAHKFEDRGKGLVFPCFGQPKLDGIRCISHVNTEETRLYSRTATKFTSAPHIEKTLSRLLKLLDLTTYGLLDYIVFDGELYNHEYKENFEKIVSLVRKKDPDPEYELIQYHIYDVIVKGMPFSERVKILGALAKVLKDEGIQCIRVVTTSIVNTVDMVEHAWKRYTDMGYEGAMLRQSSGEYEGNRSVNLLKYKKFFEDEFEIVDIEEGSGKLEGHVGSFICRDAEGKEFKAKLEGKVSFLKDCFEDHTLWEGKKLTVVYQNLTSAGIPRFGVGKAIRDYEG